jgi:RNA polymerase sigma factor (sigma-70 family)
MKITDPGADVLRAATQGDLAALDAVISAIQGGVHNLAVRMLGQRDDAADATQEILLKVVTHLGGFRGDAAFTTWVFQIARNHLLTASTRAREHPVQSLDAMAERLQEGLDFAAQHARPGEHVLTPEDKLAARQVALGCTQNMLMALDREQRLIYVLHAVFDLPSKQAAEVLGLTPEAYRQRLSRARQKLDAFMGKTCGLASAVAPCRCERQLPALAHARSNGQPMSPPLTRSRAEADEAERHFDALLRLGDAASVMRAHPDYRAPEAQRGAIRAVLQASGYWPQERPEGRPLQ